MARQIIILEQDAPGGDIQFRAAFWLAVPVARQSFYANASAQSQVKDGSVTAGELAALQNGSVIELVDQFRFPGGTTLAAMEAALQAEFTARQTALNGTTHWQRYGSSFDGTTWTLQNRA